MVTHYLLFMMTCSHFALFMSYVMFFLGVYVKESTWGTVSEQFPSYLGFKKCRSCHEGLCIAFSAFAPSHVSESGFSGKLPQCTVTTHSYDASSIDCDIRQVLERCFPNRKAWTSRRFSGQCRANTRHKKQCRLCKQVPCA